MRRIIITENMLLVFVSLVLTWVIAASVYQSVLVSQKRDETSELLTAAQAYGSADKAALGLNKLSGVAVTVLKSGQKGGAALSAAVSQAIKSGYGEDVNYVGVFGKNSITVASRMGDGSVLALSCEVDGTGYTGWCIIPALIFAAILIIRQASQLVTNSGFVFKGVIATLEHAESEGGTAVEPSPETTEYIEFKESARELAEISERISLKIKNLSGENRRIDYLLNNMSEGIVALDSELRVMIINNSAAAFLRAPDNVKGQNILRLLHYTNAIEALQRVAETGEMAAVDVKAADGQRTLQILMSAVHDDSFMNENTDETEESGTGSEYGNTQSDGKPESVKQADGSSPQKTGGVIMLISDVTAVRLTERIRSDFVANASHELKTPLTSIKGFAELLDTGIISDPDKSRGYLEHIRTETERMIGLISDILKLSELESVSEDSGRVQVSLKLIAQRVCDSLVNQSTQKNVTLNVEGEIGSIDANPDHMQQMLLNLIDNAVKYNYENGRVDIMISQLKNAVLLTVRDTGVGIPKEAQQRVFERFYRVDRSRSRKMGGTGLGLSIVKHIVGLYKGTIKLESEPGKGTTIEIILPE